MKTTGQVLILAFLLLPALMTGCQDSRTPFVGTYRTEATYAGKGQIELILKDNGEATWSLEQTGQVHKVKWRVSEGRILLYTKEGGVLVLIPSADKRSLAADMTGEWHPGCPPEHCITFVRVH